MTIAETLRAAASLMRVQHGPEHVRHKFWHAVGDWLDREAVRIGSHAITVYKVREDWYAYECLTCGHSGSASKAGLTTWQATHTELLPAVNDDALAVARAYLEAS